MLILIVVLIFCVMLFHGGTAPRRAFTGPMVSRSSPMIPRADTAFCGNCHGTGDEGFGIMPDSSGDCDACEGRGYTKIDPNAKYVSLNEIFKEHGIEHD